mmetsp:Transcript_11552/g.17099  ORF Transcript_11552/g.17099 Transcript_11552/m.17099 type:complete len:729 (-) Transcript_11552:54-2240(-)
MTNITKGVCLLLLLICIIMIVAADNSKASKRLAKKSDKNTKDIPVKETTQNNTINNNNKEEEQLKTANVTDKAIPEETNEKSAEASSRVEKVDEEEHKKSHQHHVSKKQDFNYASADVGAKILGSPKEAQGASRILNENTDKYMYQPQKGGDLFVIIELSEEIMMKRIALANFEFFSCSFKTFHLYGATELPKSNDQWKLLGKYEAENNKDIQTFALKKPSLTKFVKIVVHSYYNTKEFYRTLSLIRVHGDNMYQDLREFIESENKQAALKPTNTSKPESPSKVDEEALLQKLKTIASEDPELDIPNMDEPYVEPLNPLDKDVMDAILNSTIKNMLERKPENGTMAESSPQKNTTDEPKPSSPPPEEHEVKKDDDDQKEPTSIDSDQKPDVDVKVDDKQPAIDPPLKNEEDEEVKEKEPPSDDDDSQAVAPLKEAPINLDFDTESTDDPEQCQDSDATNSDSPMRSVESQLSNSDDSTTSSSTTTTPPPLTTTDTTTTDTVDPETSSTNDTSSQEVASPPPPPQSDEKENILKSFLKKIKKLDSTLTRVTITLKTLQNKYSEAFSTITAALKKNNDELTMMASAMIDARESSSSSLSFLRDECHHHLSVEKNLRRLRYHELSTQLFYTQLCCGISLFLLFSVVIYLLCRPSQVSSSPHFLPSSSTSSTPPPFLPSKKVSPPLPSSVTPLPSSSLPSSQQFVDDHDCLRRSNSVPDFYIDDDKHVFLSS